MKDVWKVLSGNEAELKSVDPIDFSGALVETPEHVHNGQRLFSDEGALLLADVHRRTLLIS